ncbi:MAG TPA: serine O-acetyltransferase [Ruminococcaceae bacterium]|jgi:serine O-acetyltransferase|nr:serine O-acetyltransferase [Oscillospiraceae bacterium]
MFKRIKEDIAAIKDKDPAARSSLEVMLLYNGFKAVRSHRKANWFLRHNLRFIARWISQRCLKKTNIEIHPGATIGRRLFIDHGTGVVIGETTVIGDDCIIYQGVTLGGTGKDKGKRHPTLGNNVMVGSGAKVLGPIRIGNNVRIAAGAVVLNDIPDDCTAVGVPARIARKNGAKLCELDQVHIPDPVAQELCRLEAKLDRLEALVKKD